jgi:hypothetical protein
MGHLGGFVEPGRRGELAGGVGRGGGVVLGGGDAEEEEGGEDEAKEFHVGKEGGRNFWIGLTRFTRWGKADFRQEGHGGDEMEAGVGGIRWREMEFCEEQEAFPSVIPFFNKIWSLPFCHPELVEGSVLPRSKATELIPRQARDDGSFIPIITCKWSKLETRENRRP